MRPLPLLVTATALLVSAEVVAEDWPQHLGPRRDGTSLEPAPEQWTSSGPPILWKRSVGEGFSAPTVVNRRLILFHRANGHEVVDCLDAATGELQWTHRYTTAYRDDFGFDEGPRAAPTIAGDKVFTFGAQGVLSALELTSGRPLWKVETHPRFKVRKGFFGAATSPLVDSGRVFVNVGGPDAGIVAFNAETGEVAWQSTRQGASYSSPVSAKLGGEPAVVFLTREGLVITDTATGTLRHSLRWRSRSGSSVNAATPLVLDDRIFLSASYGTGATLLQLSSEKPQPVWTSDEILSNHYATSVYSKGHLYGFHGRQEYGPALRCIRLDTGEVRWSLERFGSGSLTLVSDTLLVLHEDGRLISATASEAGFEPRSMAKLLEGVVRAYPAYSDGVLFARNKRELVAARLGPSVSAKDQTSEGR